MKYQNNMWNMFKYMFKNIGRILNIPIASL